MAMPFAALTEESIVDLVDSFYAKVRRDPDLGPVFSAAIRPDEWPRHLRRMYDFWSSVMLMTGRYKGNPLMKHAAVRGLRETMFSRWLSLFCETAREVFVPHVAKQFEDKAIRIADSLKKGLYFRSSLTGRTTRPFAGSAQDAVAQEDLTAASSA